MKSKVVRFVVYSAAMIASLYMVFMLFDLKDGIAARKAKENLLLAVIVGVMTSAFMVFLTKLHRKPKD
jgi:hypothetical protein